MMSRINNGYKAQNRTTGLRETWTLALIAGIFFGAVFVRLRSAQPPFSYDYEAYLFIIDNLKYASWSDLLGRDLNFPYVVSYNIVSIEVGFAVLIKAAALLDSNTEVIFALIGSFSVALRTYIMLALRVPMMWILIVNIFAITLFEANALRLGPASSILLYGLYHLGFNNRLRGSVALVISMTLHLQTALFVLPFLTFYVFSRWIAYSRTRFALTLCASTIGAAVMVYFIPSIGNEKVAEYVSRGASTSAGISVTSILALLFLAANALFIRRAMLREDEAKLWISILSASLPSVALLMFLTNVAVIGDRAWQLAFLILATFFFSTWKFSDRYKAPFFVLMLLMGTMIYNIIIRFPLSDFFSPPFPGIS